MAYRLFLLAAVLSLLAGCSGATDSAAPGGGLSASPDGGAAAAPTASGGDSLVQAYQDLIKNEEEFGQLLAGIHSKAGAEQAIAPLQAMFDRGNVIYQRLAELGADMPPMGIPPQYREQYKAAKALQDSAQQRLASNPEAAEINRVLQTALGDEVTNSKAIKHFRLSTELRRHGKQNIVRVELKNREGLAGPQHQKMAQMLKETAGARHAEALIEDDGTYYLVLAPVSDMQQLIGKIEIGAVSNVDPAARQFVLTLDPSKIPAEPAAQDAPFAGAPGPGGRPFPPGARPDLPSTAGGASAAGGMHDQEQVQIDLTRQTFAGAHGRDGIVEFHLKNAQPFRGPRMGKVAGLLQKAAGGRMLRPLPLRSGDVYAFFQSSADVNQLAAALDLGRVEDVDVPGRRIVIVLEESKVPQ